MSEFKIDGPGSYRLLNGDRAEVFCEYSGWWIGHVRGIPMRWLANGHSWVGVQSDYRGNIVARWPRFAVGDRVRVVDSEGRIRYATVTQGSDNPSHRYKVEDGSLIAWLDESEIVPDDRPDPGPEHRLLGDDEILEAGDERINGCDLEPRQWRSPLPKTSDYIGKTAREVNAEFPSLQILAWRRRLPKPFRISDHGPGVYETRDGRQATVTERVTDAYTLYPWRGYVSGCDTSWGDGGEYAKTLRLYADDLVRYIGPLPKFDEPEQWVPTCELEWHKCPHNVCGATIISTEDHALNEVCRLEQRWTCGDKSEWRPIPVEVPE